MATRKTAREWVAYLDDPNRALTLEEYATLQTGLLNARLSLLLRTLGDLQAEQARTNAKLDQRNSYLKRLDDYFALHVPGYDRDVPAMTNGRHTP